MTFFQIQSLRDVVLLWHNNLQTKQDTDLMI